MPNELTIEIRPRPHFRGYLERVQRWACLVVHRRGGKTFACVQDLLFRALRHRRKGPPKRYGYIAPTRDQAKDIAWGYIQQFWGAVPGCDLNQAELKATLGDGTMLRLYSGDSYQRMRGLYFDGVILDEAADLDPQAWHTVIRPTLSDYAGWGTWIGTPKGRNHFHKTHLDALDNDEWFSLVLRASESGIIDPVELADIKRSTPEDIYRQEYECDFSIGRPGAIYARAIERARQDGRISPNVLWFREAPAYTAWDVGAARNTKVWVFQLLGDRINMLESLTGDDECSMPADWAARLRVRGYSYGGHFLPHDAVQANGGLWDRALLEAGLANVVGVPRQVQVWDGINGAKAALERCWFATPGTSDGLEALEEYHSKQESDGITIRDVPVHDWASHYADAFSLAHQAIRAGMCVDRTAIPRRPASQNRRRRASTGGYRL